MIPGPTENDSFRDWVGDLEIRQMRWLRFDSWTKTAKEIAKLKFWFVGLDGTYSSDCASCKAIRKRFNVGVLGLSLFSQFRFLSPIKLRMRKSWKSLVVKRQSAIVSLYHCLIRIFCESFTRIGHLCEPVVLKCCPRRSVPEDVPEDVDPEDVIGLRRHQYFSEWLWA